MEIKWSVFLYFIVSQFACFFCLGKEKLSSEERESIVDTNIWFELAEKRTGPCAGRGSHLPLEYILILHDFKIWFFFVNIFLLYIDFLHLAFHLIYKEYKNIHFCICN